VPIFDHFHVHHALFSLFVIAPGFFTEMRVMPWTVRGPGDEGKNTTLIKDIMDAILK
jgi:hypothetical protein